MKKKNRHDRIIEILYDLSKDYKYYNRVYADHISKEYRIINILSHHKIKAAETHPFHPDLWCKHKKTNHIDIFEVWDNQSEDACTEDILFAALTPHVEHLHVVCFEKWQEELAKKLVNIILSSLFNEDGELWLSPDDVIIALIPNKILNDDKKLKKFLHDKLQF